MKKDDPRIRRKLWVLLGAIFLISFSLIAFEIALSRVLSVLLSYHYVFAVLSLALLGLGLGGMFVHYFRPKIPNEEKRYSVLAFWASLFSLSIPLSVILIIEIGYIENIEMNLLSNGFLLLVPFFLAGVLLAEVYRMFPSISSRIYGVDLIGAGAGSFGVILFLNLLGGIMTNLFLSLMAALSAVFFAIGGLEKDYKGMTIPAVSFLILSVLFTANLTGVYTPHIPVGTNPTKEIYNALSSFKGKIIETTWSAFGRTDLVKFNNYPDHMDIYIDGTAGSPMYRFNGNVEDPGPTIRHLKDSFPGYIPFLYLREEEKGKALIIGPGGGRDILLLLMGGVRKIIAVEVNQDLVDLVRKYSWYNGGIYTGLDNVRIVVDEGRNFLKRQQERYDIILLSLPVTNTSRSLEGYALSENFLFTTDSILDYLDHLTDKGRLIVVGHNDAEILRLLSISLSALGKKGVDIHTAMKQIYIVGSDEYPVLVLKRKSFEPTEVFPLYEAIHQFDLEPKSSYFPYIRQRTTLNPALMALSGGQIGFTDLLNMVRERGYDIRPVTDNSPFFYKFEIGLPKPLSLILWPSALLLVCLMFIPSLCWKMESKQVGGPSVKRGHFDYDLMKSAVLFSMLGIGFMSIEISLIQRFILFLGRPILSLAILLFSLLVGAGMGSLWSSRVAPDKMSKSIAKACLSITAMIVCYTFLLPIVFDQLLGLDLILRIFVSIFTLTLLGFLMGFPFPLGIRLLKETRMQSRIPWMWGINGVGSVLGSAMTIAIAINLGFTGALLVSASCYFIVFILFLKS